MNVIVALRCRRMVVGFHEPWSRSIHCLRNSSSSSSSSSNRTMQLSPHPSTPCPAYPPYQVRLLSMDSLKKSTSQRQVTSPKHASKVASSNKLHEALQQSLLSSTSSSSSSSLSSSGISATSATAVRLSMTTSQLAMSKYGSATPNVESNTAATTKDSAHYVTLQDRKRKNRQALVNVIFSFSLVILACQTLKAGVEKRRVQQQHNATKESLRHTQATLQQYIYSHGANDPTPEILQIADRIIQEESRRLNDGRRDGAATTTRSWFRRNPSLTTIGKDDAALLFDTNHINSTITSQPTPTRPNNVATQTEQIQQQQRLRIAGLIQEQLQLLLHDIAFDNDQKEALRVQALAATSSSPSLSSISIAMDAPGTGPSYQHLGKDAVIEDESTTSIEQLLLLESLQLENQSDRMSTSNTPSVNETNPTMANAMISEETAAISGSGKVVKKRLFTM